MQKITLPHQAAGQYPFVSGKQWVAALNAVASRRKKKNLFSTKKKKIAIIGGEPTLHPDFAYIINNLDNDWRITVTSNFASLFFEGKRGRLDEIKRKKGLRLNGSYHFLEGMSIDKFMENVLKTKKAGITVDTLFIVMHPEHKDQASRYREVLLKAGCEVKFQRFYGYAHGKLYPVAQANYDKNLEQSDGIRNYPAYREGFGQGRHAPVYCKMNNVLFAPNGDVYNCHYKLYTKSEDKFGNLFTDDYINTKSSEYFLCRDYGSCNPCDAEGHQFKRLDGSEFNISQYVEG